MGCAELQEEPLVRPAPQPPSSAHSIPFFPLLYKAPKGKRYPLRAKRIRFVPKTYTFHARNVYVFTAKRIRFARDTYTFHSE